MTQDNKLTIHDFTRGKCRWGWNIISFDVWDDGQGADVMGIGKGINIDNYLSYARQEDLHRVIRIEYESNPNDLFKAKIEGVYQRLV